MHFSKVRPGPAISKKNLNLKKNVSLFKDFQKISLRGSTKARKSLTESKTKQFYRHCNEQASSYMIPIAEIRDEYIGGIFSVLMDT